jgi:hypothetical protein
MSAVSIRARAARGPEGYTLVEVSVAAAMGVTALGLLLSAYLFAARWVEGWKEAVALENDAHLVLQRLWNDLAFAEQLETTEADTWRIVQSPADTIVYRLDAGVLARNGVRMHAVGTEVTAARLVPSRPQAWHALPEPGGDEDTLLVRVYLELGVRRHHLRLESAVLLRPPRPWRPLPP